MNGIFSSLTASSTSLQHQVSNSVYNCWVPPAPLSAPLSVTLFIAGVLPSQPLDKPPHGVIPLSDVSIGRYV